MRKVLAFIVVLCVCSTAMGQLLPIPKLMRKDLGRTTLDGDLSDWVGEISWLPLGYPDNPVGQTAGGATDMSNAAYAVRWDPCGIYYAVTVTDTVPIYLPYTPETYPENPSPSAWNNHDHLELFIDAANTNFANYAYSGSTGIGSDFSYADAQQHIISPDPCGPPGSTQDVMGWPGLYPSQRNVFDPVIMLTVDGFTLNYEIYVPSQQPAGTPLLLHIGRTVGADMAIVSHNGVVFESGGVSYAMVTANQHPAKWLNAVGLQDWILIPEPVTMVLLGLGGVALIRRKK